MRLAAGGLVGLLGLWPAAGAPDPGDGGRTLTFFFAPDSPGQAELARTAVDYLLRKDGSVRLRSVLLVPDFAALGRVQEGSPFTRTLRELSRVSAGGPLDLAVYDEEGLALARAWKIDRLPALVLVEDGTAHVSSGSGARPQDLEDCR